MTITQEIAEFAVGLELSAVPGRVIEKAKAVLLHNLTVAMAGTSMTEHLLSYARSVAPGPDGGARHWGSGQRTSPEIAAFINAATMHARTQDTTHFPSLTHVASTMLPAVLAIGEELDTDGETLLTAMIAGYEAAAAIGTGVAATTTDRGFRGTPLYGPFGGATAVGRVMGLDAEQLVAALGLAAATAGGTNQTWVAGTQEWMYQVGAACRNGLVAAQLADLGATGAPDAIEGIKGIYASFAGVQPVGDRTDHLGRRWLIEEATFKPYPVCAINQVPVTRAIELAQEHGLSADDIRSVTLRLAPVEAAYPGTDCTGPFADVGATLMSAQFCLAVALSEGGVRLQDLRRVDDPALLRLAERVEVVSDDSLTPLSMSLAIITTDGRVLETSYDATARTFAWSHEEVADRAIGLVDESLLDLDRTKRLVAMTRDVEQHGVREIVDILAVQR